MSHTSSGRNLGPVSETNDDGGTTSSGNELRDLWRHFTRPIVDTVDSRLRAEVDKHVTERVDQILADRLAVFERALSDLDRSVTELKSKLEGTA